LVYLEKSAATLKKVLGLLGEPIAVKLWEERISLAGFVLPSERRYCQVACAKKVVEHARLTVTDWICLTEEGVAKNHQFTLAPEDIAPIVQKTKESLARQVTTKM
jgi:hypothetical protein